MSMKAVHLNIEGMSCANCENTIQKALRAMPGVQKVTVNFGKGAADVSFDGDITSREALEATIVRLGYSVISEKQSPAAKNLRAAGLVLVIAALFAILQATGALTTPTRLKDCFEELTRLSRLVADIQQLANVEGNNLQLHKEKADLFEIAEAVSGIMSAQTQAKGQNLTVTGEHAAVEADRERMQQVLINLVSNAIKYTPEGGHISIETEATPSTGLVRVRDDGIGIEAAELSLIFERFYRTDQSRDRRTGGTGIGLTIAKSIVIAHGGTIRVESKPGEGSCFIIALPKRVYEQEIPSESPG